jgi:hypothetical protein
LSARSRTLAGLAIAAATAAVALAASASSATPAGSIYAAPASWLDIFAGDVWRHPQQGVGALAADGATTLYLETGNYSQPTDIVRRRLLGEWLAAAHAAGIDVVGWYLPSLAHPAVDARRALAAIRYRSGAGDTFDGFALDIEASVAPVAMRNRNLLALAATLRRAAPGGYPLGAIIPSPVGMDRHPHYWPRFPYRQLTRSFDAFLPMAYFSYYVHTAAGAYDYTRRVVELLRERAGKGVVIHLIGGVADHLGEPAVLAFAQAARDCGVDGFSLYAYPQTTREDWAALKIQSNAEGNRGACLPAH